VQEFTPKSEVRASRAHLVRSTKKIVSLTRSFFLDYAGMDWVLRFGSKADNSCRFGVVPALAETSFEKASTKKGGAHYPKKVIKFN